MNEEMKRFLELDIDAIEEKPLTDLQKQRIRQSTRAKKTSNATWKKYVAAAAISIVALSGSAYALPAIATQVPFVENILAKIDPNFVPSNYVDFATIINDVQSNNGIDMMIENAVYDGTTLMLTYAIKSEKELGEQPIVSPTIDIKGANSTSAVSTLDKVDNGLYTGMIKMTPTFEKDMQTIQIKWQPETITNTETYEEFTGDWAFTFTLDAIATTSEPFAVTYINDPVNIMIKKLDYTEISTTIHYEYTIDAAIIEKYPHSTVQFISAVDNFGNTHEIHGSGGIVTEGGHGYDWSFSLYNLSNNVTSLTVVPEIYYAAGSGEIATNQQVQLKPITIELDRK